MGNRHRLSEIDNCNMNKIISFLIIVFSILPVFAGTYSLKSYDNFDRNSLSGNNSEKILFILDYSNSMTELLENKTKYELMVDTIRKIIPSINPSVMIGLRVYGHKMGFTPIDACKASTLAVPLQSNNAGNILSGVEKYRPSGMTPITYSLKQAVLRDFIGFKGDKRIVLLTDGGENCDESPCEYVMNLIKLRKDIHIDVIAFNIKDREDLEQLKCTALVTSGKFYNPTTSAELIRSFNQSLSKEKRVEAKILP